MHGRKYVSQSVPGKFDSLNVFVGTATKKMLSVVMESGFEVRRVLRK